MHPGFRDTNTISTRDSHFLELFDRYNTELLPSAMDFQAVLAFMVFLWQHVRDCFGGSIHIPFQLFLFRDVLTNRVKEVQERRGVGAGNGGTWGIAMRSRNDRRK